MNLKGLIQRFVAARQASQPRLPASNGVPAGGISPEHVMWAYRLLLDREPENMEVVLSKARTWSTTKELRVDFMSSLEFSERNQDMALTHDHSIVIKELDDETRLFVDLTDYAIGLNIVKGLYEPSETAFIRSRVKPGQSVIDLGANIGYFTIVMASLVGAGGKVYSFEPVEANADLLARSIKENGFTDRIVLERAAAGESPGRARFLFTQQLMNSGGGRIVDADTQPPDSRHQVIDVPVISLDQYSLQRPVSFIKIDIEGAEPLAFRGAEDILRNDRPTILSEVHPEQLANVSGYSPTQYLADMSKHGYDCYRLEDGQPTEQVNDLPEGQIWSVVFLPR